MCTDCIALLPLPAFACSGEAQFAFATDFEDGLVLPCSFPLHARRVPVLRNRVMGSRPEGKLGRVLPGLESLAVDEEMHGFPVVVGFVTIRNDGPKGRRQPCREKELKGRVIGGNPWHGSIGSGVG